MKSGANLRALTSWSRCFSTTFTKSILQKSAHTLRQSSQPSSSMASKQISFKRSYENTASCTHIMKHRLWPMPGQLMWLATSGCTGTALTSDFTFRSYVLAELKAVHYWSDL